MNKLLSATFLKALINISLINIIGGIIIYFILYSILHQAAAGYAALFIPIAIITLFIMVTLSVNQIFKVKGYGIGTELRHYTVREMLSLYGRCFLIVSGGIVLALMFYMFAGFEEDEAWVAVCFYVIDVILSLFALGNIVKGEKLREENLRRIQSENAMLKSQLNPHFLYNTLNNIDALLWISPERASEAIVRLSDMMRYTTYKTSRQFVSIADEVKYIREFIELQKLRFENPDLVSFDVNITSDNISVAPMIFIPFIENAFKHATDKKTSKAIRFSINANQNNIVFRSTNVYDPSRKIQKDKMGGVGLKVVKRRLKLLYPECHSLDISTNNNNFVVRLRINLAARKGK